MQQTERQNERRLPSARMTTQRLMGQGGFSLIENMVALLVLAIGLMGVAAMQDFGLSRNTNANEVTLATNLATEMLERIRNNTKNVAAYNGIDTNNGATQPAVAQVMARGDYTQWQSRLTASRLPFVQGKVTVTAQGPTDLNQNLVVVQVIWKRFLYSPVTISTVVAPE
jgi:type IV pilus assembly protein PilV